MSEKLLGTFISREYPLKIALRFVSNDNVLVVRLNDGIPPKRDLLNINAQILEEAKLARHLQQQEQELEAANQELQATRRGLREANKELEVTRRRLGEANKELEETCRGLSEANKEIEETRRGLGEANNKIFSQRQELKKLSFLLEEKDMGIVHLEAMNFVEHDLSGFTMSDVSLNTSIGSAMSGTHSESS